MYFIAYISFTVLKLLTWNPLHFARSQLWLLKIPSVLNRTGKRNSFFSKLGQVLFSFKILHIYGIHLLNPYKTVVSHLNFMPVW